MGEGTGGRTGGQEDRTEHKSRVQECAREYGRDYGREECLMTANLELGLERLFHYIGPSPKAQLVRHKCGRIQNMPKSC